MWLKELIDPLIRVIAEDENKTKAKVCLKDFFSYLETFNTTCNGPLEVKLGILEKMYAKFGQLENDSTTLPFFISYLLSISIIYLKISHEDPFFIEDIISIYSFPSISETFVEKLKNQRVGPVAKSTISNDKTTPCSSPIELVPEVPPCLTTTDNSAAILQAVKLMLEDLEVSILYDLEYNTCVNYSNLIDIFRQNAKPKQCLQLEHEIRQSHVEDMSVEFKKFKTAIRALYYGVPHFSKFAFLEKCTSKLTDDTSSSHFVTINNAKHFQQFSFIKLSAIHANHNENSEFENHNPISFRADG